MSRRAAQLNIRSEYARERVSEVVAKTGMTATELIEDALRGYVPPASVKPVWRLIRKGNLLVMPDIGGSKLTIEDVEAAIDAVRNRDIFDDD